jgi:hypothetical protein
MTNWIWDQSASLLYPSLCCKPRYQIRLEALVAGTRSYPLDDERCMKHMRTICRSQLASQEQGSDWKTEGVDFNSCRREL